MDDKELFSLARDNLVIFSILSDRNYAPNWHHEAIAEKLEAVERGEIKRLMIFMPPRFGKSQLATINFPAWYLGRNPDKEVVTASYSGELAVDFGSKTREVVRDEVYNEIFGTTLKADAKSKQKWQTSEGGSYTSVGVGGSLTGRGADLMIIDDPIKGRAEADSETIRNACWSWYASVARTRLEKGGAVVLIQTRWHLDDLAGRLKEKMDEDGEQWEVVEFPAIALQDEEFRKRGESLWPEKYDVADLNDIRKTVGEIEWSSLFQQSPILMENQEFRKEYFRYFTDDDLKGKDLEYYTTIDLAISQKDEACETAIVTVAKERSRSTWYIVDIINGHLTPLETIDAIFSTFERFRQVRIGIETVAYQEALIYFINEEMKKRQVFLPIQEMKTKSNKEQRIRGLQPMFKLGEIHHRKEYLDFESQLLNFPKGKLIDIVDALSMIKDILFPTKRNNFKPKTKAAVNYLTGKRIL